MWSWKERGGPDGRSPAWSGVHPPSPGQWDCKGRLSARDVRGSRYGYETALLVAPMRMQSWVLEEQMHGDRWGLLDSSR